MQKSTVVLLQSSPVTVILISILIAGVIVALLARGAWGDSSLWRLALI